MAPDSTNPKNSTNSKDQRPDYWHDSELNHIAKDIRMKHHEHLNDAEISFLLTKKPMKRGGKSILGKAKLSTGLLAFYSRADFIIIIQAEAWDKADAAKRRALVDHELCHCTYEDDEKSGERVWMLRGHDIEEFTNIIDRHGLWTKDLKNFGEAVGRQLELGLEKPDSKNETKAAPVH